MKGFTLIEVLVTIGVLTILSSLIIVYSREGEISSILFREGAKIVSDLNRAKNLAISSQMWKDQKPCGYGVYFDKLNNKYIIFAEIAEDCLNAPHQRNPNNPNDVAIIQLNPPLFFKSINFTQVFFLPPDPTVYFTNLNDSFGEIIISTPKGGEQKIRIYKTGQISFFGL